MAILSIDLGEASLAAIHSVAGYDAWARAQSLDIAAGLAGLGFFDRPEGLDASVAAVNRHRTRIQALIEGGEWREHVQRGIDAALLLTRPSHPDVRLYSLVGPARSNGSATRFDGRGLVYIWLESWLGPSSTNELQDCDPRTLSAAVAHELAHAFRYALPGSHDPIAIADDHEVKNIWRTRTRIRLRDTMYDEGLAVRFSIEAFPATTLAEALSMNQSQLDWLEENWQQLLADRQRRGIIDTVRPSLDVMADALFLDPKRAGPPFSLKRPPSKWGYYVGLQWANYGGGHWIDRLASATPNSSPTNRLRFRSST